MFSSIVGRTRRQAVSGDEEHESSFAAAGTSESIPWQASQEGVLSRQRVFGYKFVILGALLPDIIDKPIGVVFFSSQGRLIGHTILFSLVLICIGLYLSYAHRMSSVLIVAVCSMGHLVLDGMWANPEVLFWPVHGWSLVEYELANWAALGDWIDGMWHNLGTSYPIFVGELMGTMVVAILLMRWLLREGSIIIRR